MIKIDESDKVEDASLYSEASNEGGDGEGERAGLPGEDLVKLVHWRGWGDSQRGMVAGGGRSCSQNLVKGLYRLSIYFLRRWRSNRALGGCVSQLLQRTKLNASVRNDSAVEATWWW